MHATIITTAQERFNNIAQQESVTYTMDMDNSTVVVWDPIEESINTQMFAQQEQALSAKIIAYTSKPYLIKLYFVLCCAVILGGLLLFLHYLMLQIFMFSFIPLIIFYGYVKHLQEEVILFFVCQQYQWIYNPQKDTARPDTFSTLVPGIFNFGYDRTFDEQIWGSLSYENKTTAFWCTTFDYTIGSGKSRHTYTEYVFAFKLPKPMKVEFLLIKPGLLSGLFQHLKTESVDFNKEFAIVCDEKDIAAQTAVIGALSPSVQTRLVDFGRAYDVKKISFAQDRMIIALGTTIWKAQYTSFFKSVSVDQRDESIFLNALVEMAELPSEMVQFI